jgi:hypothetical protein
MAEFTDNMEALMQSPNNKNYLKVEQKQQYWDDGCLCQFQPFHLSNAKRGATD